MIHKEPRVPDRIQTCIKLFCRQLPNHSDHRDIGTIWNNQIVESPITELNCSLQFTKLLHHHNAYRADSPGRDWTYNISINSRTHLPIELLGIIRNRSSMENRRLELLTSALQRPRSTNWDNSPDGLRMIRLKNEQCLNLYLKVFHFLITFSLQGRYHLVSLY